MRTATARTGRFILGILMTASIAGCPTPTATLSDSTTNTDLTDGTPNTIDGGSFTIEPDDFEAGTELTSINDAITLSTAGDDNEIFELFTVTASEDEDLAPTGTHVFGHSDIPFFNNVRRLRIDFKAGGSAVSIIFASGSAFDAETGRLEAYDADGKLIAAYVTEALEPGQSEEMSVTAGAGNIAYAVAYIADGEGNFGRLDTLAFTASGGDGPAARPAP